MSWHMITAAAMAIAVRYKSYTPERIPAKPFISAVPDLLEMKSAPIEPTWVLSGSPQARVAYHSSADDKCATTAVWDCSAGSFRWFFGWDETVVIVEGEVFVTAEDGTQRVLRAGDVAYFKAGTWATWRIDDYVRKIAFVRRPFPMALSYVFRAWNRLKPKRRNVFAG